MNRKMKQFARQLNGGRRYGATKALAVFFGVSVSTASRWINGKQQPGRRVIAVVRALTTDREG